MSKKKERINTHSGQKQHDILGEIFDSKAELMKYLMEIYSSEYYKQLSFKYFTK